MKFLNNLSGEQQLILALVVVIASITICGIGGVVLSDIFGTGTVD